MTDIHALPRQHCVQNSLASKAQPMRHRHWAACALLVLGSGAQATANTAAADAPPLPQTLLATLHNHAWLRSFWYAGK